MDEIEILKKKFIHIHVIINCCVLFIFILTYYFVIPNIIIDLYLLAGLLFMMYSYALARKKYSADVILHTYLLLMPLFNFFIILTFWNNSIGSFITLFPIPLIAFAFLQRKWHFFYTMYIMGIIFTCFLVYEYSGYIFIKYEQKYIIFSDTILFAFNFISLSLIFFYFSEICQSKTLSEIHFQNSTPLNSDEIQTTVFSDTTKMSKSELSYMLDQEGEKLFEKLEEIMEKKEMYRNSKLNISLVSVTLQVNYTYLSKVINHKGYTNFSNYLNIYRVNCVKKMIMESDMKKVTLMYIYTAAGFSNQATFNRVFKQLEGIIPTEYINASKFKTFNN